MKINSMSTRIRSLSRKLLSVTLVLFMIISGGGPLLQLFASAAEPSITLIWTGPAASTNAIYSDAGVNPGSHLELTPANNAVQSGVRFRIDFMIPVGMDAKPGEVEVRVPAYIFESRNVSDPYNVYTTAVNSRSTHAVTGLHAATGMTATFDAVTNEHVFTNWRDLTGGQTVSIEFVFNYIPSNIRNGFTNEHISASIRVNPSTGPEAGTVISKTSDPLSVRMNTFVQEPASFIKKMYDADGGVGKFESWRTAWGPRPEYTFDNDYFYVIYELRYNYNPYASTQPHTVDFYDTLGDLGGGSIVGISGAANAWINNPISACALPFTDQNATQQTAAAMTVTINPTQNNANYGYIWRWVLVKYPRGEGEGLAENVDLTNDASLVLTGIDDNGAVDGETHWAAGQPGYVAARNGIAKYRHERTTQTTYKYIPVNYVGGGGSYSTVKFNMWEVYANNSNATLQILYSAINKLTEGTAANPVDYPVLRTNANGVGYYDNYSFHIRGTARGWALTRKDGAPPLTDLNEETINDYYYQQDREYSIELLDDMLFLRDERLTSDDYSITSTYLTYTESLHSLDLDNGNLSAKDADFGRYKPVELYYKSVFSDGWVKAGEILRTASGYMFTSFDGSIESVSGLSATKQIILPQNTYEIKYMHKNSRYQVVVDAYFKVELYSSERVLRLLPEDVNTADLRNIHSMVIRDWKGTIQNHVPIGTIFGSSYPGSTGYTEATAVNNYQSRLIDHDNEIYPDLPGDRTAMHYYGIVTLNRTLAATSLTKIATAATRNGPSSDVIQNDGERGVFWIWKSVVMYEDIYFNPVVVPGNTRDEKVESLARDDIYHQQLEGTFYDLLPPGTDVEEVEVRQYHSTANDASRPKCNSFDYYTVDNWQGSGQTMLIVHAKANGATNYQVYTDTAGYMRILSGFVLNYKLINSEANVTDRMNASNVYPTTNYVAYRSSSGPLQGAKGRFAGSNTTRPTSGMWTYFRSLETVPGVFDDDNGDTVYASKALNFSVPSAFEYGIYKNVKALGETNLSEEAETIPGGTYYYQLRFQSGKASTFNDVVIFDVLEAEPDKEDSYKNEWRGTLIDVDTSFASGKGINAKVYFSTKLSLAPIDQIGGGAFGKTADATLENEEIWTLWKSNTATTTTIHTAPADFTAVTAIAVDFSEGTNGNPFVFVDGNSAYVLVEMRAPTEDYEDYLTEFDEEYPEKEPIRHYAVNVASYYTREVNLQTSFEMHTARLSKVTKVSIREPDFAIAKSADPESGDNVYTAAVDQGDIIEYTVAVMNQDDLPVTGVVVTDDLPEGIEICGDLMYYVGADPSKAVAITEATNVTVSQTGRKLTFIIKEMNAKQTVNLVIPVNVTAPFGKLLTNAAIVTEILGVEYAIESNTTYHQVYPKVVLEGMKILEGRTLKAGEFAFTIKDTEGEEVAWGKNADDGLIAFSPLDFREAGTYLYTIAEVEPGDGDKLPNISYNMSTYELEITITGDTTVGFSTEISIDGTAIAGETICSDILRFVNTFSPPPVYQTISGQKSFAGKKMVGGEFTFVVTDDNNSNSPVPAYTTDAVPVALPEIHNAANGSIGFKLKFEAEGEYVYTVSELIPAMPEKDLNIDYDEIMYTLTIVVASNSDTGLLTIVSSSATVAGIPGERVPISFKNKYTADPISITLTGSKTLTGRLLKNSEFGFTLRDATDLPAIEIDQQRNGVDGSFTFDDLTYYDSDDGKTFTYLVTELIPLESDPAYEENISYAANPVTVTVVISKILEAGPTNGMLTATVRADGVLLSGIASGDAYIYNAAAFENKYTAPPVYVSLPVGEKIIRRDPGIPLAASEFEFTVKDVTNPIPLPQYQPIIDTEANKADGSIVFREIEFNKPNDAEYPYYIFEITEKPGFDSGIAYDPAKYTLLVKVTQDDPITGALKVTEMSLINSDGENVDVIGFVNKSISKATFRRNADTDDIFSEVSVRYEESLGSDMPGIPVWPGHAFVGWNTQADGGGTTFTDESAITGDITVYAQWETLNYTVIYAPGVGGDWSAIDETTTGLLYGDSTPPAPVNPPGKHGYTFIRWEKMDGGGGIDAKVTENVTYIAIWQEEDHFTIIYDPGSQGVWDIGDQTYAHQYKGDPTPEFTGDNTTTAQPGWRFAGWDSDPLDDPVVTGDKTYIAQWERIEYTVTYDPNGHGMWDIESQTHANLHYGDSTPAAPDTAIDDPHWHFIGWASAREDTVTCDIVYKALWEEDEKFSVVYYPGDGGSFETTPHQGLYLGDITPDPPEPTSKPGWIFTSWDKAINSTVEGDTNYTAQWERIEYTVIYLPGDHGTWDPSGEIHTALYFDDITPLFGGDTDTEREYGWRFAGWDTAINGTVDGNAVYTAIWEPIPKHTVTYEPGAHGSFDTVVYEDVPEGDATPNPPETPGMSGWIFTGWSPVWSDTVTGTVTYIAQWKQAQYPYNDNELLVTVKPEDPEKPDISEDTPEQTDPPDEDGQETDLEDVQEPTGEESDLHPHVVLPDDVDPDEFTDMDFYSRQPDDVTPGGALAGIPPNPNRKEFMLTPHIDENGNTFFIEIDEFFAPLGEWRWDSENGVWIFEEYMPLSEFDNLPQTGISNGLPAALLLSGLLIAGAGLAVSFRKRKFFGRQ